LPDRKKLTTGLNSMQKVLLGLPTLVCVTKNKNDFVVQFYLHHFGAGAFFPRVSWLWCKAGHSPPSSAKVIYGFTLPLPYMPSWHVLG